MADDIQLAALEAIGADATVQAITTRGYSEGHLPQNATLPAYAVDVVSNNGIEHLGGTSVSVARVRVDAYAVDPTAANALAETIRTKVMQSTHKGAFGTSDPIVVREISLAAGPFRARDRPVDGSDQFRPFVRTDYFVYYVQTLPS